MNQTLTKTLTKADIKKLIPHREPILLVDKVTGWQTDAWLTSTKRFAKNSEYFKGHFPGDLVLPGVLMIEAMAQSAAILSSLSRGVTSKEVYYLFTSIESARFKTPLYPGQTLDMRVEKQREKLDIFQYTATATVGGSLAAQAVFTAKLVRK